MNLIIRYRICPILCFFLASGVWNIQAQTVPAVDPSKAVYVRIDSVHCINNTNHDSAYVASVAGFNVNDTILVYQPVGAEPYAPGTGLNGQINSLNNVGRYAIVKISEINAGQKLIVFNTTLPPGFTKYTTGEFGQIVRIPTYTRARIAPGFDFPEWDPLTRTGGIFVVLTRKRLELEADLRTDIIRQLRAGQTVKVLKADLPWLITTGVVLLPTEDTLPDILPQQQLTVREVKVKA